MDMDRMSKLIQQVKVNLWNLKKLSLWTKLIGLSGKYQSVEIIRI